MMLRDVGERIVSSGRTRGEACADDAPGRRRQDRQSGRTRGEASPVMLQDVGDRIVTQEEPEEKLRR